MKLSAYSLKTGIFVILVIILFLAMILVDIVVTSLYNIPFSHPYQKIVFFYILLNTLFLALLSFYFIYRSIIKPINRLVKKAEEFKEGDTFFLTSGAEQNEFGKLSSSLNAMLRRLEDNKAELKTGIRSLEKANLELQQAQEEIIRSEKLASVGKLASGVAHEIGNPIGIVLGYLGLLKGSDLNNEERQDFINRIEKEIGRVNRTIRNLLDFSRPSKGEMKVVSVHKIIGDMVDILKPQPMVSDSEIFLDKGAKKDNVLADPDKLKQVFLNLSMNAIDAMGANQTKNSRIYIEFVDNGPGIPAEDLTRIFDPFYTTKEPGKGTGLGLSVSLRIIEDIGGDIKVKSEPGKGTKIIVILPLYSATKSPRPKQLKMDN
ncbi:MAG: hypothetical protein B6I32_07080 [Desulfobacterium sp. 4572_20]|nr:MAG: hypothetical protein B6I32_07080 [Desulfobacterium sp. 4572_20]